MSHNNISYNKKQFFGCSSIVACKYNLKKKDVNDITLECLA